MSQQPQGSIVDRIIEWWKRLFGPPNANETGTTPPASGSRDLGGTVREAASKANAAAERATGTILNKVQEQVDHARGTASSKVDEAKADAEERVDETKASIESATDEVKETTDNAIHDSENALDDARGFASEQVETFSAKADDAQAAVEAKVDEAEQAVHDATDQGTEAAADTDERIRNLSQAVRDKFKANVTDRVTPLGDEVENASDQAVDDAASRADEVKANAANLRGAGQAAAAGALGVAQAAAENAAGKLQETTDELKEASEDLGSSELFLDPKDEPALPDTPPPDVEHSAIVEGDVSGTVEDVPSDLPDDDAYSLEQVGDALSSEDVAEIADSTTTDGDDEALVDSASEDGASAASRPTPEGAVPSDGSGEAPEGYSIKGNATSHIYHLPGESSYEHTNPDFWFATEEEAQAAGYRPRKR